MTPVLRVSGPGQLAALVPHLVGFVPAESLVALSLRGERARVGLTLRGDLADGPGLLRLVGRAVQDDGAAACALLVFTEEPSTAAGHPAADLVAQVVDDLADRGVEVTSQVLVRSGTWVSYDCALACCPPTGTPVEVDAPAVQGLAAAAALEGRAVLASREALVESLGPHVPLGTAVARRRQEQALRGLRSGPAEVARWRAALDAFDAGGAGRTGGRPAQGHGPAGRSAVDAPALAAGLHLVAVRDTVLSWTVSRSDALLAVALQVCRGCVPPHDAPAATVLAWVAYARGDGALALVALQRALRTDPSYSLAGLLLHALEHAAPPALVRRASALWTPAAGRSTARRGRAVS